MKANFNIKKTNSSNENKANQNNTEPKKELTKEEFEEFIVKSGAKGSFMVYRSNKKDNELGIEQL